ncbi:MAG: hemerythrin family protein [Marinobacterium sp.]|nr:hemerythrin family protein [Marinobacterium sp.]
MTEQATKTVATATDAQQNTATPLIDAAQIPAVALDFMNHDHSEAVALSNALYARLEHSTPDSNEIATIDHQLELLYQHNEEHFAREEQHMQEYGFPPYPIHKGEHDRVLAELREIIHYWKNSHDTQALRHYLKHTFVSWFQNHLMSMDRVTAMFVAGQMTARQPQN